MLGSRGIYLLRIMATIGAVAITCSAHAESLQDIVAQRKLAQDWLDGKVQPDKPPKVAYTGLPFTIRVTGHQPATASAIAKVITPALRILEKMSNGKIVAYERYGQAVHPEKEGVAAILAGTADFAPCYSVWDAQTYPLMQVMSLPGLYPSTEIATVVSEQLYDKYFRHDVEKQGVVMGRLKAGSESNLFSRKPIRAVADFAGLRMAVPNDITRRTMLALGATATVMSSNQLAKAFADGEVDAVAFPDGPAEVFGIDKVAKYRTALSTTGRYNAEYCLSKPIWQALPRDLQVVFNTWARAQAQAETQIFYGVAGAISVEKFRSAGIEIIELDAEQQRILAAKTSAVIDDWIAAQEAAGRPARQLVEDVKGVIRRFHDVTPNELMRRALNDPIEINRIRTE